MAKTKQVTFGRRAIKTYSKGVPNGFILPLYNEAEGLAVHKPKQVYVTTVNPGMSKGPHLHKKRAGMMACVAGKVVFTLKSPEGKYFQRECCDNDRFLITVPPFWGLRITNIGTSQAIVVNMTSRSWTATDPDDYEADFSDSPYD